MKTNRIRRAYRKGLRKTESPSLETLDRMKHLNLRTLKVCFGPCRCFSAAKR